MGCVQTRSASTDSPPTGGGGRLRKMKEESGYVAARRSLMRGPPRARSVGGGGERRSVRENGRVEEMKEKVREVAPAVVKVKVVEEELVGPVGEGEGWPKWLTDNIPKEVLDGLVPRSADSYDKLAKVGQGTYSNVYKARDRETGKIVALKKVRFDTSEIESIRFMAREIMILQKLDHPNIIKLEGLATSRMQYSLYLVFEFMQSDLARVISRPDGRLTEPQVKCYMHQLLSGLKHCHERGILHRDIKGSNLLIDKQGMLKIADFGLANYFNPNKKRPLTSRVVTLWYRAPELLLGTTDYGVGIDLWSAGCLLAEMFAGRPIMPGRTEVEQLHRIFKLCGSPPEDYWRKLRLSTNFRPPQPYKSTIMQTFRDFPSSSLGLLKTLLALDPSYRGSATFALQNDFFSTSPLACDLSGLPVIYKEEDDELIKPRERRKRRSSRLKQRPRTEKEDSRNPEQDITKPKVGDSGLPEERYLESAPPLLSPIKSPSLHEKPRVQTTYSNELRSNTGSTSSHAQAGIYSVSPPPFPPALKSSSVREQGTEARPSGAKNIQNLPSRQASRPKVLRINNQLYGMDRSSSASGFRRFEGKRIPKR